MDLLSTSEHWVFYVEIRNEHGKVIKFNSNNGESIELQALVLPLYCAKLHKILSCSGACRREEQQ